MVATDALAKDGADTKEGDPARRAGFFPGERAVVAAAARGSEQARGTTSGRHRGVQSDLQHTRVQSEVRSLANLAAASATCQPAANARRTQARREQAALEQPLTLYSTIHRNESPHEDGALPLFRPVQLKCRARGFPV